MSGQVNIGGVWKDINGVYVNIGGVWKTATGLKCNIGGVWKEGWSNIGGIDSYTKLMLHMNGTNGSTTFTDSELTPKSVTAAGNAQISTAQSKFGGASGLFDGTGDYLELADNADWAFGTEDLTIDFWVRFISVPTSTITAVFYSQYNNGSNMIELYYKDSALYLQNYSGGTPIVDFNRAWTPTAGTWYHIAVVRTGNTFKMFINGTQIGTDYSSSNSFTDFTNLLRIGARNSTTGGLNGYIDEYRISKGVARWTTNFTPPTSQYTT